MLEKLRQSILAAAFRGDLTKEWRAEHKDVEPASELLKRIRVEHRKRWEEAELANMRAKGKAPTDDRWRSKYAPPESVAEMGLPPLPYGWSWVSVGEVITGLRNGIATKPDKADGLRILRISALRPLRLDVDDVRFLPVDEEYESYLLSDGDLLLTRYNGNPELVGVAAVVRGIVERTVYPDKLMRAAPLATFASADFLELALNTGLTRRHIAKKGKSAAGQVGVSGRDVRTAPVPLPPIAEQIAIVRTVQTMLDRVHAVGLTVHDATRAVTELESSLFAKAFRGELVPQDPNDEPAEALLARLRAAEPAPEKPKPRRRRSEAAE